MPARAPSEWDQLDPQTKRRDLFDNLEQADKLVVADRALIEAMLKTPIDTQGLHRALSADATPDRIVINGFPALHVALHKHDLKALDLLLSYGASTDDFDSEGANALDVAYRKRFPEAVKRLKDVGAETRLVLPYGEDPPDPVAAPSYETRLNALLYRAVTSGTPQQVRQALALGANANSPDRGWGTPHPPLHAAVAMCQAEKVRILLDAGADVFARTQAGEETADMLWAAPPDKLLGPDWRKTFDLLHDRGYTNFFVKPPEALTLHDLRAPVPLAARKMSLLQHLVESGHGDMLFEVLDRNPQDRLAAADLLVQDAEPPRRTVLQSLGGKGLLPRLFTEVVWQGRLEEMLSLRAPVEDDAWLRGKVDFNKAAADVRACRLRELKSQAPKLTLKTSPKPAQKSERP